MNLVVLTALCWSALSCQNAASPAPGSPLVCWNVRGERPREGEQGEFARFMATLTRDKNLPPPARYESKRFTAWSNATDEFTVMRLRNCEVLYDNFLAHFRRKGFAVREPATK